MKELLRFRQNQIRYLTDLRSKEGFSIIKKHSEYSYTVVSNSEHVQTVLINTGTANCVSQLDMENLKLSIPLEFNFITLALPVKYSAREKAHPHWRLPLITKITQNWIKERYLSSFPPLICRRCIGYLHF